MATATVDHCNNLLLESIPVVDLRLLSQPELLSLSLRSSNSPSISNAETELSTPKIDRSIFNESAGSRKQTFFRLRFAGSRGNSSSSPSSEPFIFPPRPLDLNPELDEESSNALSLLKSLFEIDDSMSANPVEDEPYDDKDLVPVQIEYPNGNLSLTNVPIHIVSNSERKRKRGRPRRDETGNWFVRTKPLAVQEYKQTETVSNAGEYTPTTPTLTADVLNAGAYAPTPTAHISNAGAYAPTPIVDASNDGAYAPTPTVDASNARVYAPTPTVDSSNAGAYAPTPTVDSSNAGAYAPTPTVDASNAGAYAPTPTVDASNAGAYATTPIADASNAGAYTPTVNASVARAYASTPTSNALNAGAYTPTADAYALTLTVDASNAGAHAPLTAEASSTGGKRKRGRPRREESQSTMIGNEGKKVDSEIEKAVLRNVEKILGIEEELRRQTEGIVTEAQLLEFMKGLEGEWASKSQKKRIIDAAKFGDVLPIGWKLMLFVKRRVNNVWLACSRYISPNGQQFVSCKDVSSYLLSLDGLKDPSLQTSTHTDRGIDSGVKPTSLPRSSEHEKQAPLLRVESSREVQKVETIKCHKCTMTFSLQDDFIGHLLSSHRGSAMSSGQGIGTSINEELKIKNGKYECQFCHELFEEMNCYSSHLEIHMKNNMKKVEGSVRDQNTIQPLNSTGNNGTGTGFGCIEFNQNALVEDKYNHESKLLSHDEKDKVDRKEKVLADKNYDKQNNICFVTENKGGVTDTTAAADLNVCLGSENVLFMAEKEGISQPSDKVDVRFALNSMEEKKREMASNPSFLAPNGNGNFFTDENIEDRHFPSFLKVKATRGDPKVSCAGTHTKLDNVRTHAVQEIYSEGCSLIPSGNKQGVSLVDHLKGASVTIDSTNERGSGCGLTSAKDDQTCVINNNLIPVSGSLNHSESIMVSESGSIDPINCFQNRVPMKKPSQAKSETVLLSSHGREQIVPSDNNAFKVFSRMAEVSERDEAQNSRRLFQGVNSRGSGVDATIPVSVKHEQAKDRLFSPPSYKKTSTCTAEYKQDKGSESILYQQYASPQNSNYETSMNKAPFFTTEEPKHKPGSSFVGHAYARPGTIAVTGTVQESYSPHFSGNREKNSGKNNAPGINSGTVHEPKQNKGAFEDYFGVSSGQQTRVNDLNAVPAGTTNAGSRLQQTHVANNVNMGHTGTANSGSRLQQTQVANNLNTGHAGTAHAGPRLQQTHVANNLNMGHAGITHPGSRLEQTHVANNLNMGHASTAHVGGSRLQDFENARNNEMMIGYSNHARPIVDSMTGLPWKSNEGNVLLNGLADTSSQLLPSSGYYPTFDWMSHKGESEMFDISGKGSSVSGFEGLQSDSIEHMEYNFLTAQPSSCSGNSKGGSEMFNISGKGSNQSGFEGLRPDNLEHMEYSFLTAQPSSRSGNSKVPPYDSEMGLKFDNSVWLGKDALPLLPKIAGRHQVPALCSWCGNQFYNEAVDIGAQRSTMVMCANCRARFSRNHDFM